MYIGSMNVNIIIYVDIFRLNYIKLYTMFLCFT